MLKWINLKQKCLSIFVCHNKTASVLWKLFRKQTRVEQKILKGVLYSGKRKWPLFLWKIDYIDSQTEF